MLFFFGLCPEVGWKDEKVDGPDDHQRRVPFRWCDRNLSISPTTKKKYPCAFIVGVEIELHMVGESFDGLLLRAFAIGRDHGP